MNVVKAEKSILSKKFEFDLNDILSYCFNHNSSYDFVKQVQANLLNRKTKLLEPLHKNQQKSQKDKIYQSRKRFRSQEILFKVTKNEIKQQEISIVKEIQKRHNNIQQLRKLELQEQLKYNKIIEKKLRIQNKLKLQTRLKLFNENKHQRFRQQIRQLHQKQRKYQRLYQLRQQIEHKKKIKKLKDIDKRKKNKEVLLKKIKKKEKELKEKLIIANHQPQDSNTSRYTLQQQLAELVQQLEVFQQKIQQVIQKNDDNKMLDVPKSIEQLKNQIEFSQMSDNLINIKKNLQKKVSNNSQGKSYNQQMVIEKKIHNDSSFGGESENILKKKRERQKGRKNESQQIKLCKTKKFKTQLNTNKKVKNIILKKLIQIETIQKDFKIKEKEAQMKEKQLRLQLEIQKAKNRQLLIQKQKQKNLIQQNQLTHIKQISQLKVPKKQNSQKNSILNQNLKIKKPQQQITKFQNQKQNKQRSIEQKKKSLILIDFNQQIGLKKKRKMSMSPKNEQRVTIKKKNLSLKKLKQTQISSLNEYIPKLINKFKKQQDSFQFKEQQIQSKQFKHLSGIQSELDKTFLIQIQKPSNLLNKSVQKSLKSIPFFPTININANFEISVKIDIIQELDINKFVIQTQQQIQPEIAQMQIYKEKQLINILKKKLQFTLLKGFDINNNEIGYALIYHNRKYTQRRKICVYHISTKKYDYFYNFIVACFEFIFTKDPCDTIEFYLTMNQNRTFHVQFWKIFSKKFQEMGKIYQRQLNPSILIRKFVINRPLNMKFEIKFQNKFNINVLMSDFQLKQSEQENQIDQIKNPQNLLSYFVIMSQLFRKHLSQQYINLIKLEIEEQPKLKELIMLIINLQKHSIKMNEIKIHQFPNLYQLNQYLISKKKKLVSFVKDSIFSNNVLHHAVYQQKLKLPFQFHAAIIPFQYSKIVRYNSYMSMTPKHNYDLFTLKSSIYKQHMYIIPTQSCDLNMLLMSATEFLKLKEQNLNLFTYVKTFMNNVTKQKKANLQRLWLPGWKTSKSIRIQQFKQVLQKDIYVWDECEMMIRQYLPNSVILYPSHNDLIISPPFIIGILNQRLEKVSLGSPLFCRLIDEKEVILFEQQCL